MHTRGWSSHLRAGARGCLYLLVFLTPLFVLPGTLEPLELNKQTLLLVLTSVSALCWLGSMVLEKRLHLKRGLANLLPLLWVSGFVLAAWASSAPYVSWAGAHSQQYTSALTALASALLMYLLANTTAKREQHTMMHTVLIVSATLTGVMTILMIFGIDIFGSVSGALAFNSVGTLTSLAVYLITVSSFLLASHIAHKPNDSLLADGRLGSWLRWMIWLTVLNTFFILLLIDASELWLIFIVAMLIPVVFALFKSKAFPAHSRFIGPLILALLAIPFWLILSSPITASLPIEVTPDRQSSQQISDVALQGQEASLGSGPGTYAMVYGRYHDGRINQTDFWQTRFDRASSYVLTLLPTIGTLGLTFAGGFILLLFLRVLHQLLAKSTRDQWLESFVHTAPWLTLVLSAFLVPWNMTLTVMFATFSGLLLSQTLPKQSNLTFQRSPARALLASFSFVILAFAFIVGIFLTTQRYVAQIVFADAVELDRSGASLQSVLQRLDTAAALNSLDDTYVRALSEALLLRVDEVIAGIDAGQTPTSESTEYLQGLVAAAVNAGARATELSPDNALNWLVRGNVYRELIPVMAEAANFSIENYTRATELEPMNPSHWTELGQVYLSAAEILEPFTAAQDEATAAQAKAQRTVYLESAEVAFVRAIDLKSNYASAHYQLGLTFREQGRINEAIGKLESVAQYNRLDVGVAFQLGTLYLARGEEGDLARAENAFVHAINLAPSYANAYWFLATVYEVQDDLTRAVQAIEAVLSLEPENRLVAARLERLLVGDLEEEVPEALEETTQAEELAP